MDYLDLILNILGGIGGDTSIEWLLYDDFATDESAPLTTPRTSGLKLTDVGNILNIADGKIGYTNQIPAVGNLGWQSIGTYTRTAGLMVITTGKATVMPSYPAWVGWWINANVNYASGTGVAEALYTEGGRWRPISNQSASSIVELGTAVASGIDYKCAVVLRNTGAFYFLKSVSDWSLLWVSSENTTANLYATSAPISAGSSASIRFDWFGVRQLPAPFDTDQGIASVNTTTFTQSLGPELLTNGDFSAWTGDNPNGWTVSEVGSDPMVTEAAGGARFYSSATNFQPRLSQTIATIGSYYELGMVINTVASGGIRFADSSLTVAGDVYTTNGSKRFLARFSATGLVLLGQLAPTDITVESVSAKQMTLNAVHSATADGIHDFNFTVPSPSLVGQRVEMRYRINADTPDLDYWVLYLVCTATNVWNIRLDSVAAGVATNRVSVSSYGPGAGATVTLRAICQGSLHDVYTFQGTTWTKRGNQINVSHQNTSTGLQAVYSSTVTPNSLRSYPLTDPSYDEELDKA